MPYLAFALRLFVWFSLRNFKAHLGRTLTVLFGIALGAAVFTSVRLSVHASLDAFTKSIDHITGRTELTIVQPGGYVPENLISKILKHPAIDSASPILSTYVRAAKAPDNIFLLVGFDPILDRSFRDWQSAEEYQGEGEIWIDLMKIPYSLILGKSLSVRLNSGEGDLLSIEHSQQISDFKVVGTLKAEDLGLVEGQRVALTDIATFQEFTGLHGKVDRIDIRFKGAATEKEVNDFRATLPEGVVLSTPYATRDSGRRLIGSYQLNLSILSFASLFVGMFLVYSLVALNAASRRKEIAVLRAIGASGNLIFFIFLAEGAFFGLIGWVTAIPLSSIMVKYMIHGVSETISTLFVRVAVDKITLNAWEIGLSFGITFLIAIVAALQPAKEAMQVAPNEALEIAHHGMRKQKSIFQLAATGITCILLVIPLSRLPGILGMPLPGYLSMFLLFLGFSLLAPGLLEQLGKFVSPVLHRWVGVPAYLAGRYVRDSGTRTAVSVGALMTAVALFTALVIMINSFRQTVELWTFQTINGDLFLTTRLNEANQFRMPIPKKITDGLKQLETPVDLVPNRRFFLTYGEFPYEFEVLDMDTFLRYGDYFWMKGDPEHVHPMMHQGKGVIVSEVFSNRTGLTVGDIFEAQVEGSKVTLPVIGVVRDYRTQGGVVFYSMDHFRRRYHDPQWSGVRFYLKEQHRNVDEGIRRLQTEIIKKFGDEVDIISGKELRRSILRVFDETFAITSVLLIIALIIAALGIATTLTVLVLERTRQLNTLLALGAGSGQIRSMIFWEAAFLVVAGELAGLVCGFILSYILVYVINKQSFGWTFIYGVNWNALGMSVPLIILTAMAAALPAIQLVFRRPPAMLLRER